MFLILTGISLKNKFTFSYVDLILTGIKLDNYRVLNCCWLLENRYLKSGGQFSKMLFA